MGKAAVHLRDAALLAILDSTQDVMFVKDIYGVYVAGSMPFVKMVGKETLDQVIGKTDFDIFEDHELAARYVADDKRMLDSRTDFPDFLEPLPSEDGRVRYGSTSKYILYDEDDEVIGLLGITKDITQDHLTRQYYHNEMTGLLDLASDIYATALIDIEDWRIVEQHLQIIGDVILPEYGSVEAMIEGILDSIAPGQGDGKAEAFYRRFNQPYLRDLHDSGETKFSFEYVKRMPDGSMRWVQCNMKFMIHPETGHYCLVHFTRDIDSEKREELDLEVSARMDKMTMLLNRETIMEEINRCLRDIPGHCHTLLMLDVDNFKNLNDSLGHQEGDEFLIALAKTLRSFFRENDIVGRIGGDEFFVLMKSTNTLSLVEDRIENLLEEVRGLCAGYPGIGLSVSIGVSRYPDDGKTLEALYAQADRALYEAKAQGKNRVCFA